MRAKLEKVTRADRQSEETEIAHDLPCEVATDSEEIVLTLGRDVGIQVGDELECDAFDWKRTVRGIRRERTEQSYRFVLGYC